MPAMPEPRPKVSASTRAVRMPMAAAMSRFCVTARMCRPKVVLRSTSARAPSTTKQKTRMTMRFQVMVMPPMNSKPPVIQDGFDTSLFGAPKMVRTSCCRMRLTPQVASRVSSGRP